MFEFLIVLITFIAMEFVSWGAHKYIMHGFLWNLHKDHHEVDHSKFTQKNDWFFLIFAIPSILLISYGIEDLTFLFFIGLGIACYGFAYVIVHEIIIHRRIPFLQRLKGNYIKTIRRAHKVHHKNQGKYGATCFGMLVVPKKYWI
jgi:beta-carotene 3-hydroxylase